MGKQAKSVIDIDESLFLYTFEDFQNVIVKLENATRRDNGELPLTADEEANLFLEMREKYGIT